MENPLTMTLRPIRAYREINRDLGELRDARRTEDEAARLELARRAHVFTKRSRKVVDETMNLSAVLMRAGEVDEATRLLAEVDREVETEKAALLESVNEVRSREVVTRHKMTRLRMAKMLLTAILGASLMMFSAFGFALAKFLAPAPAQGAQNHVSLTTRGAPKAERAALNNIRHIHFAGMKIALTPEQMAEFERLTASGAGDDELQEFLRKVLSPDLAKRIVAAAAPVTGAVDDLLAETKKTVKASDQSASTSPEDKESPKKTKEESDDGTGGDGGDNDEKNCKDDSGEGEGEDETSLGAPGPGCIPVVNEESPI